MAYIERNKILSVRVTSEMIEKLDAKAKVRNVSRTDYVLALLGKDTGIKVEPPKISGEERIIALEKKIKELEGKIIDLPEMVKIILAMRQAGQL